MQNENINLIELQEKVNQLESTVESLSQSFFKNNFSSSQTFTKDAIFSSRLRVPVYSAAPTVGEVGDLISVSGVLYICTTAGDVATPAVFTLVGTQS